MSERYKAFVFCFFLRFAGFRLKRDNVEFTQPPPFIPILTTSLPPPLRELDLDTRSYESVPCHSTLITILTITLAAVSIMATFTRQPFAEIGASRLQVLQSAKNRQNGK